MKPLPNSWAHAHGSLDPGQYASLALTHVQYHPEDPFAIPFSLITLSPPFLIVVYVAICLIRRDLTICFGFIGQLACEAFNLILKRIFKQGRPTDFLGTGYGMPSSHSQFVGYFMAFWCLHFFRNRPTMSRTLRGEHSGNSLIDLLRRLEHAFMVFFIIFGSLATAYSRYYLSYHTPLQIIIGLSLGIGCGIVWYYMVEMYANKPHFGLQRSLRRILLENPIFVALRIRDSWAVWDDGGIEAEYGLWRKEWDRLQMEKDQSKNNCFDSEQNDLDNMLFALRLADKCDETSTAFCVGCVITNRRTGQILETGYSREEPGNTHAEEVAINKICLVSLSSSKRPQEKKTKYVPILPLTLYTTMEPCSERLSKKDACVQRILKFNRDKIEWKIVEKGKEQSYTLQIERVVQGVSEPEDFVLCKGMRMLQEEGLQVEAIQPPLCLKKRGTGRKVEKLELQPGWLEREAIRLAKYGHPDQPKVQANEDRMWKEEGWEAESTSRKESKKKR